MRLFMKDKLFSLHEKMVVTDENDNIVYRTKTRLVTITDKTTIEDTNGRDVAHIKAKLISLHGKYEVTMADGLGFELSQRIFRLKDVIDVDGLGWQLQGRNILGFDFDIIDGKGNLVAMAHNPVTSLFRDRYEVDVFDDTFADEVVAIFIVLRHIIDHRQEH